MTEREYKDVKLAVLYELRLLISGGDKSKYTKEEITLLIDKIAMAKKREI